MRHHIFVPVLLLFLFLGCQPSSEKTAIERQLRDYPESRVLDIYKSFCQDNLGPGHMIPDARSAKNYLEYELQTFREDLDSARYDAPGIMYYPVGDKGNYVRVDLSVVLDGLVDQEVYLDAFVRSANEGKRLTEEQWVAKWKQIEKIIRKDFPDIPNSKEDLEMIGSHIDKGELIIHHSEAFSKAYNPHYRIIARDIFEKELKPRIEKPLGD